VEAARIVYAARESITRLLNAPDPLRVILCGNATGAINLALAGYLKPGDHVITSSMEHNSMMRPLRALERDGLDLTVVPCSPRGDIDPGDIARCMRKTTVLISINHGSNVNGCVQPILEIGRIARARDVIFMVDAAQTAGSYDIDMERDFVDLLAFTGHKGLFGPPGTGGLVIGKRVDTGRMKPLLHGGTGSRSEFEAQPEFLPDKYESGTPNTMGIAGLGAGVDFVLSRGTGEIWNHEMECARLLVEGLERIKGIRIYSPGETGGHIATVSFTLDGIEPGELGSILDERFNILCRVGLHCSPASHKTLGTFPGGTVRFSIGFFNTVSQIERALNALEEVASKL
jgi:cysteine desulfurase family protein